MTEPYISFVATARNDNHGGQLLQRMQVFIDALIEQCARHRLSAELVLVEWNPPSGVPGLAEALAWPEECEWCPVRVVQVPPSIHGRFKYSDQLPLFQMIAKNVGIRRSRAPYVCCTNVDILFNHELMTYLAAKRLREREIYRVDRYDVPATVPVGVGIDAQLAYCAGNVRVINRRFGSVDVQSGESQGVDLPPPKLPGIRKLVPAFAKENLLYRGVRRRASRRAQPHTNAAGDFTLLHRRIWDVLKGYPELEVFSLHIDSLLIYQAIQAGSHQRVLSEPMRIYHIDHSMGWTFEAAAGKVSGRSAGDVPHVTEAQLLDWITSMRSGGRPLPFNSDNWGLATDDLPELTPISRTNHMVAP